jgi:pimeloyl-ACP methyl ester carboxylesterase
MKIAVRIVLIVLGVVVGVAQLAIVGVVIHGNLEIRNKEVLTAEANAPGRLVMIEGHRWHVVTMGDVNADTGNVPVLLLHGFAVPGHAMWLPWADGLAKQRALIMPDLLGYGYSERIPTPGSYYTLASYAASLAAILDELEVAQVDVVGQSYGGVVAARFALDYPNRVRRVVFINSPLYSESSAAEGIIHLPLGIGRAVTWHMFGGGALSVLAGYCRSQQSERCMSRLHVKDTTDTVRAMMDTHRHTPDAATLLEDLPGFTAPAMVIWGANDRFFPVSFGERLARETKAKLVIIPDAGHIPYLYRPDEVTQHVTDFLRP